MLPACRRKWVEMAENSSRPKLPATTKMFQSQMSVGLRLKTALD